MINVLFVYRGYGESGSNSVIDFQLSSLTQKDINVDTFQIKGGGIKNYLHAIFQLRDYLKKNETDVIHAHYSFSGFIAGLATRKPVVCSLMGSDILKGKKIFRLITWFFYKFLWKATIVKSTEMQNLFPKSLLIPNGVDFLNFRPIPKEDALATTGFNVSDHNIIFVAEDPAATIKNLKLAKEAVQLLGDEKVRLQLISGKTFIDLPYFFNAADVLLLTSLSEGSPNVIKEAMACNCPIVSTDVGDVRKVIGNTEGCYITSFDARDVSSKLEMALAFNKRTNGREAIQRFDSRLVADKIIALYKDLLKKQEMIGIVDYGMGNLRSVKKKLDRIGADAFISAKPDELIKSDKLILPGVGHFGNAVKELKTRGLWDYLNKEVSVTKKPMLGICLGMQLMARHSEEGDAEGFGWFDADIIKFKIHDRLKFKIPNMGWENAIPQRESIIMRDIVPEAMFYFVHSYHIVCNNKRDVLTNSEYEYVFTSAIQKDNIFGTQFHPEKSHDSGEQLLKNFAEL